MPSQRSQTSISNREEATAVTWGAGPPSAPRAQIGAEGFSLVGRYGICEQISSGGMASIHLGFLMGTAGFSRFVALKRMHAELSRDAKFAARFKHEVLLGAQIRHPNVIPALDVIEWHGEILLVMEFIEGENLAGLLRAAVRRGEQVPLDVALGVVTQALHGLHAAHEARGVDGAPLHLVHRDFSPENVLVGSDGHARVLDFGIAKSSSQSVVTRVGHIAGKIPYMAPEQLRGEHIDRRADIFSVGVVLWEALTGERLFGEADPDSPATILEVLSRPIPAPSKVRPQITEAVERVVLKALNRDPSKRFGSAREFALELEKSGVVGGQTSVSACVQKLCADRLRQLAEHQARAASALQTARRRAIGPDSHALLNEQTAAPDGQSSLPLSSRTPAVVYIGSARAAPPIRRRWSAALSGTFILLAVTGSLLLWAFNSWRSSAALQGATADGQSALSSVKRPATSPPLPESDLSGPMPVKQPTEAAITGPVAVTQSAATTARPVVSAKRPIVKSSCSQPIYLDERGFRHFKPQCL